MKKVLLFMLSLFIIPLISVYALELSGTVTAGNGTGVPDSTVVIIDLDMITLTDADGNYSFTDVPDGNYTLLVIAPAFEEKEFSSITPGRGKLLQLVPEVVEMDTITVQAEREAVEEINEGVTAAELERQPVRSDPFDAAALESGILKPLDVINVGSSPNMAANANTSEMAPVVIPETRLSAGGNNRLSVYGGDSDWNNYYYDYIRLPTNKHTFGYPEPDAIIPREAVDSIEIYKGAYPVEYGPGIGGLFTLNPKAASEEWEFTFTPSIMDISGISTIKFTDDISMLISLNQSILNYTVIPLLNQLIVIESESELEEGDNPTSISYGDLLISLLMTPPGHNISVDFIAYYDHWAFDLDFEEAFLKSDYVPYFIAGGSKWVASINSQLSNSLFVFGSLYEDNGNFNFHLAGAETGFTTDYSSIWKSNVNSLQAGDEVQWSITPEMMILTGINGRIADLNGTYTDDNHVELEDGTVVSDYDHNILFEDFLLSAYGYAKLAGTVENLDYQTGAGILWYPESGTVRPAVEGEVIYSIDYASFAFAAGWSPGIIDEFSYIDRRLDEIYYELDTETSAAQPPMAATAAGQAVFLFSDDASLNFSPYFSWYYDLSGISMNTSYSDLDSTFISLEPAYGYSTGIDISWGAAIGDIFEWDLSYAFSWTRYMTEEIGWTSPNTEVQHAIKGSGLFTAGGFTAGLNVFVYSGQPFTPLIVETDLAGEPVIVQGEYNSIYNYIPSYELTVNLNYDWDFEDFDMSLFFNSSNLLAGLNINMLGLKESVQTTVGATTADFSSRDYIFDYSIFDFLSTLLTCEIGMRFSI